MVYATTPINSGRPRYTPKHRRYIVLFNHNNFKKGEVLVFSEYPMKDGTPVAVFKGDKYVLNAQFVENADHLFAPYDPDLHRDTTASGEAEKIQEHITQWLNSLKKQQDGRKEIKSK